MALACLSWIEITVKCCSRDKEEWKGKRAVAAAR